MERSLANVWAERLWEVEQQMERERLKLIGLIEDTADLWNERELIRLEEAVRNVCWRIERIRRKLGDERTQFDATEEATRE